MAYFDTTAVRQRLESDRQRLEDDIYQRTEGDAVVLPSDPLSDAGGTRGHSAEEADAMADAERNNLVLGNSRTLLEQVNAALTRLDEGTYGLCQRCGKPIDTRRLEALPYALYDRDCQDAVERESTTAV